eukprot:2950272-Alexandrium_andersonii.AAC.1
MASVCCVTLACAFGAQVGVRGDGREAHAEERAYDIFSNGHQPRSTSRRRRPRRVDELEYAYEMRAARGPVSYTHLTLPTICSV